MWAWDAQGAEAGSVSGLQSHSSLSPPGSEIFIGFSSIILRDPYVDFRLIRNSTIGIPITMCHFYALKPDFFEAKDESSLRVLARTHICKSATLSPFKAPFLQCETCSPHNKGFAADCSPLIPCSPPDHQYPCADLHHTPSNARFWGQACHSAQSFYVASQEGSGPVRTFREVWQQK